MKQESLDALGAVPLGHGPDDAPPVSVVEELRRAAPEVAAGITQVVVDNPGTFVVLGAGAVVAGRLITNFVRPRTPLQALAVFIVVQAAAPAAATWAVRKGWLKLRVRDHHGCLVPLDPDES